MELSDLREEFVECPECNKTPLTLVQIPNCVGMVWRVFEMDGTPHVCPELITNDGDDNE